MLFPNRLLKQRGAGEEEAGEVKGTGAGRPVASPFNTEGRCRVFNRKVRVRRWLGWAAKAKKLQGYETSD